MGSFCSIRHTTFLSSCENLVTYSDQPVEKGDPFWGVEEHHLENKKEQKILAKILLDQPCKVVSFHLNPISFVLAVRAILNMFLSIYWKSFKNRTFAHLRLKTNHCLWTTFWLKTNHCLWTTFLKTKNHCLWTLLNLVATKHWLTRKGGTRFYRLL